MKISAKAVFGSVLIQQITGALWYSKFAFFASWAAAQGKTPEQLTPTALPFVLSITYAIVSSYAIAWAVRATEARCPVTGARTGALVALAFTVPALATHYAFLQLDSWVIVVDAGKELVCYALSGALFGFLAGRAAGAKSFAPATQP
jgi:hypothetical protein